MKRLPYLWIGIFSLENLEIHGEISATIKKGGPNYLKSQKSPVVGQSRLLITKGRTPSKGRNNAHWGRCRYNIYIIYIYNYIYICICGGLWGRNISFFQPVWKDHQAPGAPDV